MMGKDIERIISNTDSFINTVNTSILEFAEDITLSIKITGSRGLTNVPAPYSAIEVIQKSINPMTSIISSFQSLSSDLDKMNSLKGNLYVSSNSFNSSIGSPWNEFNRLKDMVNKGKQYSINHKDFLLMGKKVGMISILNMILSNAVDFKYAITNYHDYIQRGYDNEYNNKRPSITFKTGLDKITNANIKQKYDDNVNIPVPSIDPF